MNEHNLLIKSLGKSIKTEIKHVSTCKIKFFNTNQKEIKYNFKNASYKNEFFSLAKESIYILNDSLDEVIEVISYKEIEGLELDPKYNDWFYMYITTESHINPYKNKEKRRNLRKISIRVKSREYLVKNILCYYSIFFMWKENVIKDLKIIRSQVELTEKEKKQLKKTKNKGLSREFRQVSNKNYDFFVKFSIISMYNNSYFLILLPESNEEESFQKEQFFSEAIPDIYKCELVVDIENITSLSVFEEDRNARDISYYSYNYVINYMKNTKKISRYWITENRIFFKKYNINLDISQWEAWRIEVKSAEPWYKDFIFIIMRRKFIPPFFDSFQNFHFILSRSYERQGLSVEINSQCEEIIELAANSIFFSGNMTEKDYLLMLNSKIDSLLFDEETVLFFMNTLNIQPPEVFEIGYSFVYIVLLLLETSNEKEKFNQVRLNLEAKIKDLNNNSLSSFSVDLSELIESVSLGNVRLSSVFDRLFQLYRPNIKENKEDFLKAIREEEEESVELMKNTNQNQEMISQNEKNSKYKGESLCLYQYHKVFNLKKILFEKRRKIEIWKSKCFRFLSFCLNGGLTDYSLTYETLIEVVNRTQSQLLLSELNDFIFNSINLKDIDYDSIDDPPQIYIPSISERINLSFNEDVLCVCIKTGWLAKYLAENIKTFPSFLKILLKKHVSNKILNAIYGYLKYLNDQITEDGGNIEERVVMSSIISPLLDLLRDIRRNPMTLLIVSKSLGLLICKEIDKKNRIIMIQEEAVPVIYLVMDIYNYDDKLVMSCLETFSYLIPMLKSKMIEYISEENFGGVNFLVLFKQILKPNRIVGAYYSQRIIAKVLTTLLSMTNLIEIGIKERFNSPSELVMYDILLNIVDETNKRQSILNPKEENSYIVEYKVFYLLFILLNKNEKAKNYLFSKLNLVDFINKKSDYLKSIIETAVEGILNNKGYTDNRLLTISEMTRRFFEFCYCLILGDDEKIHVFYKKMTGFNSLLYFVNENRGVLRITKEFDVYNWILRLYKEYNLIGNMN